MKKIFTLIAFVLAVVTAGAQAPGAIPVEPGSKGQLPEVKPVPGFTEENRFGALLVSSTLGSDLWASDRGHYKVDLSWWAPSDFGGEYYTLQYRYGTSGEWTTEKDTDGNDKRYGDESRGNLGLIGTGFEGIPGWTAQFRLLMHGGPLDGYLSNEVTAHVPTIFTTYGGYGSENEPWYNVVGQRLGGYYNLRVRAWDEKLEKYVEYGKEDGVYNYAWYRVNPTTRDAMRIEGADKDYYVPMLEDVGYWLYCEISGDGEHCDFIYRYLPCSGNPMVCVPVTASPAYFGPDGFVLNTDYILPTPGQDLYTQWWDYNEDTQTNTEMRGAVGPRIIVRKPGQYGVRMTQDEYLYNMVELSPELMARGYLLTFTYQHGDGYYDEDGNWVDVPWYRECQLMADRYMAPMTIKPMFGGRPVPTTVDIIGPNIDGELVVVKSVEQEELNFDGIQIGEWDGLYSLGEGYYLKVHPYQGWSNLTTTYYPEALLWGDAKLVKPAYGEYNEETGNYDSPVYTISVQEAFSPLTGEGIIEGTISDGSSNVRALFPSAGTADEGYTVFLRLKGGDIVATTETDATGKYRFENVPYGTYEVLVNIDGCVQEQPAVVSLSADNPTVTDVDYSISGTEILATAIHSITTGRSADAGATYTLDGRRISGQPAAKGLYIVNGRKVVVK